EPDRGAARHADAAEDRRRHRRRGRAHRRFLDRRHPGRKESEGRKVTDNLSTLPPLDGVRVIDLTRVVAGPYCTMMLGHMGDEVLKIEEPRHGDDSRGWGPFIDGWSSFFLTLNRSKKSVALDLRSAQGAEALRRLIATAEVLIENFRPGSLRELGFG